jgi:predicted AAA+ superfamily ATPase
MSDPDRLFDRLDQLLDRLERLIPPAQPAEPDWSCRSYRWQERQLRPVTVIDHVDPADLLHIERQAGQLERNTAQFLAGQPANNALLWGARGTGKSSVVKSLMTRFEDSDLCLVEVAKKDSESLSDLITLLASNPRHYIIYMDDLSFEADDESYKSLKAVLEGSIQAQPDNIVIYATSNRRHLMPESMQDNLDSRMTDGQLHPGDAIEEKISLSDRFGLWLSFHPFTQNQYLDVVEQALKRLGLDMDERATTEALRFATSRGSRSGRIARQFATWWLGAKKDA